MSAETIGVVCLLFLLFLLLREVVCWYWKLSAIVEKLGSIDQKLAALLKTAAGG